MACLLWRDGAIVQSVGFEHTNIVGDAQTAVDFFNVWGIDEIVLLNVSREPDQREAFYVTVEELSKNCFVPLTVGGWVRNPDDIRALLSRGADKISTNTEAVRDPEFIERASETFGSQCITVSIDAKRTDDGEYQVVIDRGREPTGLRPDDWAREAEEWGAGEIFLTSIDQDGAQTGYDTELIRRVAGTVRIPVVASGGVGEWEHLVTGIEEGNASAVSVANRFHHIQHSTTKAKQHMLDTGLDVREPAFAERYDI